MFTQCVRIMCALSRIGVRCPNGFACRFGGAHIGPGPTLLTKAPVPSSQRQYT